MNNYILNQHVSFKNVARIIIVLIIVGMVIYGFEHFGGRYMSRLSAFVAEQGSFGPIAFMAVNAVATMFLVPQSVFTVAAGALFGWKMGAVWASIAMTGGASGAFLVARYGVRDWLGARFKEHVVFRKMQHLSQTHPLQVISLSRCSFSISELPVGCYPCQVCSLRVPYLALHVARDTFSRLRRSSFACRHISRPCLMGGRSFDSGSWREPCRVGAQVEGQIPG